MSDNRSRGFEKYDSMTTEELEEILRLDAEGPEDQESDEELIFYIMGVLADRKRNENTGDVAQKAWESFKEHYMPANGESEPAEDKKQRKIIPLVRRLTAVAAAFVIVIGLSVSAKAFSLRELWDVFARWTKETFSFVTGADTQITEPSPDRQQEIMSLQELLENSKLDPSVVPTWIPEGFELEKVESEITPAQEIYWAFYSYGERELTIYVRTYLQSDPPKAEINDDLVEIYEMAGVQYYLFSNQEQTRAVWLNDIYQCNISGDISIDELKGMIDSIGKG